MSGTGGLTKAGTGIFTLSGANTYTGATAINAGTLRVAGGAAIADTSAVTLANVAGAILDLNGTNETIGSLAGGGAAGGNVTLGAGTLTTGGNNGTTIYTGILSGTGGMTKQGTGIFTLSGANTYTGATTINAGTLTLGAANRIADASAVTVAGGATFNLNNFAETIGSLSSAGNVTLGTGILTAGGDNSSTTFSGVHEWHGGVDKARGGHLHPLRCEHLQRGNHHQCRHTGRRSQQRTGDSQRVARRSPPARPWASPAGSTMPLRNRSRSTVAATLSNLVGNNIFAGPIALGAGSETMTTVAGTTLTANGVISGAGALTKDGTGTLTLWRRQHLYRRHDHQCGDLAVGGREPHRRHQCGDRQCRGDVQSEQLR